MPSLFIPKSTNLFRNPKHDYRQPFIYLITMNKATTTPPLSVIHGRESSSGIDAWVEITDTGQLFIDALTEFRQYYPFIRILNQSVMPDHVHILLRVLERMDKPLGDYLHNLKVTATLRQRRQPGFPSELSFFEKGYHDRICQRAGQRQYMYEYVRDNPLRRYIINTHPDFFTRLHKLQIGEKTVQAYGNPYILDIPEIAPVRISRHTTPSEFEAIKQDYLSIARNKGVLVSPFINHFEREVMESAIEAGGYIIKIEENGFGERFKPSGKFFRLCAESRLLIIAPAIHRIPAPEPSKRLFENMNAMAVLIADYQRSRAIHANS